MQTLPCAVQRMVAVNFDIQLEREEACWRFGHEFGANLQAAVTPVMQVALTT